MPSLFETGDITGFVQVVVERSIDRYPAGLTYAVSEETDQVAEGDRVLVPLGRGNKSTAGYIIETFNLDSEAAAKINPEKTKRILQRDAGAHRLPPDLIQLARWISGYYCTPIGMVLATMLPAAVKRDIGRVSKTMVDLAEPEDTSDENQSARKPTPQQQRILEALENLPADKRPIEIRELKDLADVKTVGPIRRLIERGQLTQTSRSSIEASWIKAAVDPFTPEALTDEQQQVTADIAAALDGGFSTHLLFGITGSGKTEVYIRLIQQVLERGKSALMLVPEISLTPQTGGRLIGRFPSDRVAILHSGLTAAQRNQQWVMAAEGRARVIIGARSAVFAPIPHDQLGLIIVDEEHDGSYKQDQLPRYHGRDVAIRRAQLNECVVLLGSATPSLESWENACRPEGGQRAKYTLHRLTERVPGATLPRVQVVDFRQQMKMRKDCGRVSLIGPTLEHEIGQTLADGFQVLLLLNRRGYANYIACPDHTCGYVLQCDQCDTTMVYHRDDRLPTGGYVRCHHCLGETKLLKNCPDCNKNIVTFGLGTQRVERELLARFPQLVEGESLMRVDSDTMHSASHFHDVLSRFAQRELKLLIGTQMIAKGLDFPGVRLVGVINADTAINLPDFRASERTFQLVNQVAGRSGRGDTAGKVIVQSFQPDAAAIQRAAQHDYVGFANEELELRAQFGLPPTTRMTRIVVRDENLRKAEEIATKLSLELRALAARYHHAPRGENAYGDPAHAERGGTEETRYHHPPDGEAKDSPNTESRATVKSITTVLDSIRVKLEGGHPFIDMHLRDFVGRDPFPIGENSPPDLNVHRRNLPHLNLQQATYFVSWRVRDGVVHLSESERKITMDALLHFDDVRCRVYACVVMPDHVHWIVRPFEAYALKDLIRSVKTFSAKAINATRQSAGRFWDAEDFDHIIRDDRYASELVRYVTMNPVNAGLCNRPFDYAWTFVHDDVLDADGKAMTLKKLDDLVGGPRYHHAPRGEDAQGGPAHAERGGTWGGGIVHLRGPMPCPISRIAGKHRQQIEITASTAGLMQTLLADARNAGLIKADTSMAIDVDPIALL